MYLKMSNFKCMCEMKSVIKRIKEIIKYKNRKSRKNIREKKIFESPHFSFTSCRFRDLISDNH